MPHEPHTPTKLARLVSGLALGSLLGLAFAAPASATAPSLLLSIAGNTPAASVAETIIVDATMSTVTAVNSGGLATSYSITGTLPSGVHFDAVAGTVSGTPGVTMAATTYTVTAHNASGTSSATLTLTVLPHPPNIQLHLGQVTSNAVSEIVYVGTKVSTVTPVNHGGPITSYAISGMLPAGVQFSSSTGVISGTPTATMSATTFTIKAVGPGGSDTATYSLTVLPTPPQAPVYTLTFKAMGSGAGSVAPSIATLVQGTVLKVRATAAAGSVFAGWSGDCSGTANPLDLTATKDMTCSAQFTLVAPMPQSVPSGTFTPQGATRTHAQWLAGAHATTYEVRVNGSAVCTTSALMCNLALLLGPNSTVEVVAINASGRAPATALAFTMSAPVRALLLHFPDNSAFITAQNRTLLRTWTVKLGALGYRHVSVYTHNDSAVSAKSALRLSRRRASAVIAFMRAWLAASYATHASGSLSSTQVESAQVRAYNAEADIRVMPA